LNTNTQGHLPSLTNVAVAIDCGAYRVNNFTQTDTVAVNFENGFLRPQSAGYVFRIGNAETTASRLKKASRGARMRQVFEINFALWGLMACSAIKVAQYAF
jgi:hypothetical protein